jgi:hypothetical protein
MRTTLPSPSPASAQALPCPGPASPSTSPPSTSPQTLSTPCCPSTTSSSPARAHRSPTSAASSPTRTTRTPTSARARACSSVPTCRLSMSPSATVRCGSKYDEGRGVCLLMCDSVCLGDAEKDVYVDGMMMCQKPKNSDEFSKEVKYISCGGLN